MGELEFDDMPLAMQHLFSPDEVRAYDTSMVPSQPLHITTEECEGNVSYRTADRVRDVRKLSLSYFRARLIEHFDIKFKAGEIKWPRSRGKKFVSSADKEY